MRSFFTFLCISVLLLSAGIISCGSGGGSAGPTPPPDPGPNPTCSSSQRTFTITNSTSEQLWLGVTGGSLPCFQDSDCPTGAANSCAGATPSAQKAGHCSCNTNSDCGSQATCNTSNNICFMSLPNLSPSQVNLPAGQHSTICMPAPVKGQPFQWSGNMFVRTGCDSNGQHCQTGDCNAASNGLCPAGTGGNPPTALAEFTLSAQNVKNAGPDYYDISIINGINVGVSMTPASGSFTAEASDPYSCGAPGSTTSVNGLAACNWTFDASNIPTISPADQRTLLRDVTPVTISSCGGSLTNLGYCGCTSDAECSGGTVCGIGTNAAQGVQYKKVCGTQIGWWTADQLCKSSNNTSPDIAKLDCAASTDLLACIAGNAMSCYNDQATAGGSCCGCATSGSSPYQSDWPSPSPGFGGSDNGCYGYNNNWFTLAQPWLVFMKKACSTAYTYPFDDATSTFTCNGTGSNTGPNYNVTFFPIH